ncbi:hypothetical protein CYMTET_33252, partial [Cymbomonas tetramitiformis]
EAAFGPSHPVVGQSLLAMATFLSKTNRQNEAQGYWKRQVEIMSSALDHRGPRGNAIAPGAEPELEAFSPFGMEPRLAKVVQ